MSSDIDNISEYSESNEYEESNGDSKIPEMIKEMVKVEKEVYDVYKYFEKEVERNGGYLLKNMRLRHVYELMYPNYNPLF